MDFSNMLNRIIQEVVLSQDKESIMFRFVDGFQRSFGVGEVCCSHSWIEHLELPQDYIGATLLRVEEGEDVVPWDGHTCDNSCGHDVLQVYNTKFHTDRGTITLEYRNDSNGYYGGYLIDT